MHKKTREMNTRGKTGEKATQALQSLQVLCLGRVTVITRPKPQSSYGGGMEKAS